MNDKDKKRLMPDGFLRLEVRWSGKEFVATCVNDRSFEIRSPTISGVYRQAGRIPTFLTIIQKDGYPEKVSDLPSEDRAIRKK